MKIKYQWKRYWTPPNGHISLNDDGFLEDPTGPFGKYINSNLVSLDTQNDIGCLILLGEPGIGKSTEIKKLYDTTRKDKSVDHSLWIDLKNVPNIEFFRDELIKDPCYQNWANNGKPLFLFLDSLDESIPPISIRRFMNYFYHLLSKNRYKIPNLYLRISCRTVLWPSYLESKLTVLWGKKACKKYELCPLTKRDVKSALGSQKIDKDKFLSEVRNKDVAGLAGKPLTLKFLMDAYGRDDQLPERKGEIYSRGCELLIQEWDLSKRSGATKPTLTLLQKIAVAERIAVATLIGGKPTIVLNTSSKLLEGEIDIAELHGTEIIDDVPIPIGDEQIREVLNTGLFSSRGNEKVGWAHQTYGEFLAAQYIARHKLGWRQTRSFLFYDLMKTGVFRVVPQLYEVSAWLASLDSTFFDNAVLLDPEFLLLSDINVITDPQKKVLVEQLLTRLDQGKLFDRWETFNAINYKKMNHPDIAKQLEPYIKDATKGIVVRRVAMEIASACSVTVLERLIVKIAFDENENLSIRVQAVLAIANMGCSKSQQSLKRLVDSGFQNDPEDELKGVVLQTLWPKYISAQKLFRLVTPSKNHSFLGRYHNFLSGELASSLCSESVNIGLEWIESNAINVRDLEYSLKKLSDAIMTKAWENISSPEVLEKFAHVAHGRLKEFEEIISERAVNKDVATKFQKALESQDKNRRNLIKRIAQLVEEENSSPNKKDNVLLHHREIRLVLSKDTPWLIKWLSEEGNKNIQKIIAEIIAKIFDTRDTQQIDLIYNARKKNSLLRGETNYWFEPMDLSSETTKNQRKQWIKEQSWQTRQEKNEREETLKYITPEKIIELLVKSETENLDFWWRLNNALCVTDEGFYEADFKELRGWKLVGEDIHKRIIECGKKFLAEKNSDPDKWLGQNKLYFPALAGYREIKELYSQQDEFLEKQGADFWKRWASITLGFPLVSNEPDNGKIIALAYKHAPDEIISTLDVLIDDEAERYNGLLINDLLEDCLDDRMRKFLLDKAQLEGFSSKAAGEILRFLLNHNDKSAKEYVKSKIQIPLPEDEEEKEEVLSAAASLLQNADQADWKFLWDLILKDNEFGRSLVIKAHGSPLRGSGVLQSISESQLADLYIWLSEEFSSEEYSRPKGVHTVTPQISIGDWGNSVIKVLMNKGTSEACKQIKKVAAKLPQCKWIKQYTLVEAQKIALQKSWQPSDVSQIFKLVENHDLRLVNSPDELMDTVLDSLKRLDGIWQEGEQPRAIRLWNQDKTKKPTISWPKNEPHLSDEIACHLKKDLDGIVIGREVEVKRNKTDIFINTFTKDHLGKSKDLIKVTIEVKGCWHGELNTAMESQLVGQYLSKTNCQHGIYLIGWFICDKWNDTKGIKLQKTLKINLQQAREKFEKQAKDLSFKYSMRVNAVVLDLRI